MSRKASFYKGKFEQRQEGNGVLSCEDMCISVDGVSQAEETVGARSFLGIYFVSRPK